MLRSLAPGLLPACLAALAGPAAMGQSVPPRDEEPEPVLLQPLLGRVPLADSLGAYPSPEGVLVPLGEIMRLLGFGIQVDAARGRAEGFFIRESRRFRLDLGSPFVEVDGRKIPLPPGKVRRLGQELYVESSLLAAWFPFEVKVDLKAAILLLKPLERLPIQDEWEREGRYIGGLPSLAGGGGDDRPVGQALPIPYSLADLPFVDLSVFWGKVQNSASTQPAATATLAGDLLWMSAIVNVSRDQQGRSEDSTWTLLREDPHAELLGPLHAKRVELGDILQSPTLGPAGMLPRGRGLLVDNYPIGYRSRFATRTFSGFLAAGWSVELYQNFGLIGFQKARPDGRYEFQEIPLRFGLNLFKLVFHGPFGQTREEQYRVDIANDQPKPGELFYRVAGVKPSPVRGGSALVDPLAVEEARKKVAVLAQVEYGLSRIFALSAGSARATHPDQTVHTYEDVGLRAALPYLSVQVDATRDRVEDRPPGSAREILLRTGWNYSTFTLQRTDYRDGFRMLDSLGTLQFIRELTRDFRAQWDGTVAWGKRPIAYSLARQQRMYADGSWSTTDIVRSTFTFPSFTLTPILSRTRDSTMSGSTPLDGILFLTGQRAEYSLQGEADFRWSEGKAKLTALGLLGDRIAPSGLIYRVGFRSSDATLRGTALVASINKLTGHYGCGLEAQYSRGQGYGINLRLQASFGREPRTGRWVSEARPMAGLGAMSAVAFMDANGNRVLDPGERLLEGTQFKVAQAPVESSIKDPSVVLRPLMPRAQEVTVQVDETTLEDASLQSVVKVYRIVPRPGKVAKVDFPVAPFGEINGTARIRRESGTQEFGGLELVLSRPSGEKLRSLRSAYDGFFEFRDLPLGDYVLRVSPEDVRRLKLKEPPSRSYHLDTRKNFLEGQDFIVEPLELTPRQEVPRAPAPGEAAPPPRPSPAPAPAGIDRPMEPVPPPASGVHPGTEGPGSPPSRAPGTDLEARLQALAGGDLPQAHRQGEAYRRAQAPGSWTLRLETARRVETVKQAVGLFGEPKPDLWILPLRLRDGGIGSQVFLGAYRTRAEAERQIRTLPALFLAHGNLPQAYPMDKLPSEEDEPSY